MPSFPFTFRTLSAALFCASLMACGSNNGEGSGGNAVSLKDLEVVDGTTSDAMTDLDGVKSEGTATAPVAINASTAAPASRPAAAEGDNSTAAPEEVVSDQ